MAEAVEDDSLPVLKSWVINLHLQQDTAELYWKWTAQDLKWADLANRLSSFNDVKTDFSSLFQDIHFQVPTSSAFIKSWREEWKARLAFL